MGLLDAFLNRTPEQNKGLLAAATKILDMSAPSRVPRNIMQIAAHGMNAFEGGVRDAQQQKLEDQLYGLKVRDAEADFEHQQTGRARRNRISNRVAGLGSLGGLGELLGAGGSADSGSAGLGGLMNPEGLTPASHMNGSVFTAALARAGLPDNMETLNKIVDGVNRGMSPDDAAAAVRGEAGMQGQQGGSTPQQGAGAFAPSQQRGPAAGSQGMSMPTIGSPEWMRGMQQQAGEQAVPSLDAPFTTDMNSQQFWLQSAMPGRALDSARSAGARKRPNQTQAWVQRLMTEAQIFAEEGDHEGAAKRLELVQKFRPNATWKEVRQSDGRVVNMPFFDDGTEGEASGAEVAERLNWQNTGPETLGLDAFDGSVRARHKNGLSPSTAATVGMQRERLAFDKQQASRPVFNESMGGYMLPPSPQNPAGVFIPAPGRRSPKLTEFQGKSAAFGMRAEEADRIHTDLQGKYSPAAINSKVAVSDWPLVGGALGALTNKTALSDNDQMAEQAQRDFINAVLRQESGAAIADTEFDNARKQYFPQPGDSEAVIKQKARNRQISIQGLKTNAGPGAMTAAPPVGEFSVTAPDGQTYDFPDAKSLANFKLTTGIR